MKKCWISIPWWVRWWLRLFACVVALWIAVTHIENFRARRAWDEHIATHLAHALDLYLPEASDDDAMAPESGFFDSPFLKALRNSDDPIANSLLPNPSHYGDYKLEPGMCIDLQGNIEANSFPLENFFPKASRPSSRQVVAQDVLRITGSWLPTIESFREAANRPPDPLPKTEIKVPADIFTGYPDVAPLQDVAKVIALRFHAHLILNDFDKALDLLLDRLRFSRNLAHRGTLVETINGLLWIDSTRQIIWSALSERVWTREQLLHLATELESIRPTRWTQWAIWMEYQRLISLCGLLDTGPLQQYRLNRHWPYFQMFPLQLKSSLPKPLEELPSMISSSMLACMPRGWAKQNALYLCESSDIALLLCSEEDPARRALIARNAGEHRSRSDGPYNFLSKRFTPLLLLDDEYTRVWETYSRQMRLAVALEIHYLDHGRYPENLEALARQFAEGIPTDPWSGKPFDYRLQNDRPELASVGYNGTGGDEGDIFWKYPVPTPPGSE